MLSPYNQELARMSALMTPIHNVTHEVFDNEKREKNKANGFHIWKGKN